MNLLVKHARAEIAQRLLLDVMDDILVVERAKELAGRFSHDLVRVVDLGPQLR